jgi:hypothetical protein
MYESMYRDNEPSSCILSDCCNLIIAMGDDPYPFEGFSNEDFVIIMQEVAMSIKTISDNITILHNSTETEQMFNLIEAMRRVNSKAIAEVNENRNYDI